MPYWIRIPRPDRVLYKQGQGTECVHRRVSEHLILVSTQHVNPRALLLWHGGMYLECDNTSTLQPAGVTTLEDYCSAKEWTSWRFVYLLNHIQLQWPTPLQLLMITENKSGIKLATCRITLPTATSSLILEILLKCTFRTGRALRELVIFAS